MVYVWVLVVVFFVVLIVVSTIVIVPCVVVASLFVVVVVPSVVVAINIPLLVACETMYVTIVVEVSLEVVGAHTIIVTNVVYT